MKKFLFLIFVIPTVGLGQGTGQDQPRSAVLDLKSAAKAHEENTAMYRELASELKDLTSQSWKTADELTRKAASTNRREDHIAAIKARIEAISEKLTIFDAIAQLEGPLRTSYKALQAEIDSNINSLTTKVQTIAEIQKLDLQDLEKAYSITRKCENVFELGEDVFELLRKQELSEEEVELIDQYAEEVRSLVDRLDMNKYTESVPSQQLDKLNQLRLHRVLEHLAMQRGVKRARFTIKNLQQLVRNDRDFLRTIELDDIIAQAVKNPIPEPNVDIRSLIPKGAGIPTSQQESDVGSANRAQRSKHPGIGPSSSELEQGIRRLKEEVK
jgi:hypothetical protein